MSSISKFLILVPPIIAEKVFVPPVILIVPSPASAGVTTALIVTLLSPEPFLPFEHGIGHSNLHL